MANKYRQKVKGHDSGTLVTTKSPYGSHVVMVVDSFDLEDDFTSLKDGEVVCKDDKGCYITLKARLDNGLSDPNRYSNKRK